MNDNKIYNRKIIENEYDEASAALNEFEKVKWASQEKMINRFRLAMRKVFTTKIITWLDVGCGTGAFQSLISQELPSIQCVAIDLSSKLLNFARSRTDIGQVDFKNIDFLEFSEEAMFDVITCIGVLQKTNISLPAFFAKAAGLLKPNGMIFVDTKHIGWNMFKDGKLTPEIDHQWFSIQELKNSAETAGLKVECIEGYLPGEDLVVEPEESHTIFLVASKRGR